MTATDRRYVTVDVFTDTMLGGNPLAVVLDSAGLTAPQMQALASEFNYSETTFVLPPETPGHTAHVRIFTPSREVPFAGHPNVGTAFALARQMAERGERVPDEFVFEEAAGLVPLSLMRESGVVVGAELLAPEKLSRRARLARDRAAACLSLAPEDIRVDRHEPQVLSVGLAFLVTELVSRDALRRAKPARAAYQENLPLDGAHAVYAYTRDVGAGVDCDVQARMFSPRLTEDPATGSATGAAAALLAELQPVADGEIALRFRQGVDMGRPSLLATRVGMRAGGVTSVHVGGRCVAAMQGTFRLPGVG